MQQYSVNPFYLQSIPQQQMQMQNLYLIIPQQQQAEPSLSLQNLEQYQASPSYEKFLQNLNTDYKAQQLAQQNLQIQTMQQQPVSLTNLIDFSSLDYIKLSAQQKHDQIWQAIMASKGTTGKFPSGVELGGIFMETMGPTFSTKGDVMPKWLGMTRRKFIHSLGATAKCKFVSNGNHPYTGIFKGASHGIIRISSAAEPKADGSTPLTPGFGLKFLRDGVDSANLVAMNSVEGQNGDWNVFSREFYTHIGAAQSAKLKVLSKKFSTATKYIQQVGLSDMAGIDEKGQREDSAVLPFSLTFKPHADVHTLFPTRLPGSDPLVYVSQLETVPASKNLYDVYALNAPREQGGHEQQIGTIQLDGVFTKSKWGDEQLFFRHQRNDEDIRRKPEWDKNTPKCPFFG